MVAGMDIYPRVEFAFAGSPRAALLPEEIQACFDEALALANEELEEAAVFYVHQFPREPVKKCVDPDRNILLGVRTACGEEPIDIVDLKGLDETTIKPADALAREIVLKVKQHLLAKKTDGIIFSSTGTKFDPRFLGIHRFGMDEKGYLLIDNARVLYGNEKVFRVIKADVFHTYTICRVVAEGSGVRVFDDYDLVRENNRGMFVDCKSRMWVPPKNLLEEFREDATAYKRDYVQLKRDELTPELKGRIIALYRQFPKVP